MRKFADLGPDTHDKLPWPVCRCSNGLSLAFTREDFDSLHKRAIHSAWEEAPDPASSKTPSNSDDDFHGTPTYLVITGEVLALELSSPVLGSSLPTLRSLSVPDSVEEIRDKCFYKNATLTHVRFGESSSLKRIGCAAFYGCPLEYIHIPNRVEVIGSICFGKTCLSRVTFGETSSLKRIEWKAFFSCQLTRIHFPKSLEELHDKSFCQCGGLSRVTFEEPSSLKYIGIKAFAKCSLKEILIPDSLEELCDLCFYKCASFSRITFGPNSSLKSIGRYCFLGCSVVNFSLPHGVLSIGGILMMNGGFDYIFRLSEHCLVANDARLCYLAPDLSHRLPHPTVEYLCGSARSRYMPHGIAEMWPSLKVIGPGAFAGQCAGNFPNTIEELGEMSFWRCHGLCHGGAFGDLALKRIGAFAFCESDVMKVELPKSLEEIGRGCFACAQISRLEFQQPSSLKLIGPLAFFGCRLVNVTIPDTVEEIGDNCFARCRYLSVSFGESSSLKRIGVKAFSKSGVHEIIIPDSVEEIGDGCFSMCPCLSSIGFGESSSLRRIGVRAFSRSGLRGIKIPDSVEEIGDECFYMCGFLSAVAFGESSSLTIVGADAFGHCQLPVVPLPGGVTAREPVSKPRVVKIAIMGPRDSGKTSVIKAYTDPKWTFEPDPNLLRRPDLDHVYSVQETFGGETYELQIVEVDLPSKRPLLYSDGIIDDIDVVISVNRADKLVGRHARTFDSGELYPWAPEMRVVSAVDRVKPYMLSSFDGGPVRRYVQCSAKTGENIREVFLKAIELHVKDLETKTPHATHAGFVTPDFTSLC